MLGALPFVDAPVSDPLAGIEQSVAPKPIAATNSRRVYRVAPMANPFLFCVHHSGQRSLSRCLSCAVPFPCRQGAVMVEELVGVAVHEAAYEWLHLSGGHPFLLHQFGDGLGKALPRHGRVAGDQFHRQYVAAEGEELVRGRGHDEFLDEAHAGRGVDDPGPAHVHPGIGIMLCQGDHFVLVGVVDVEEVEAGAGMGVEECADITGVCAHAVQRHAAVPREIPGVQFHGEFVFRGFADAVVEEVVLQGLGFRRAALSSFSLATATKEYSIKDFIDQFNQPDNRYYF